MQVTVGDLVALATGLALGATLVLLWLVLVKLRQAIALEQRVQRNLFRVAVALEALEPDRDRREGVLRVIRRSASS
jgi:hypothetical protein